MKSKRKDKEMLLGTWSERVLTMHITFYRGMDLQLDCLLLDVPQRFIKWPDWPFYETLGYI